MRSNIKVGDIMTRDFVSAKPETSIKDCAREMIKKRVGSLIIKEGQKLKGLLTEREILWAIVKKKISDLSKIKAKDIAIKKVTTIKPSASVSQALGNMKKNKIKWLPVTVKGNVIGMLTLTDILRLEPSLFDSTDEIMQIREMEEKLKRIKTGRTSWITDGICEECGNFDVLYKEDGRLICEACRDVM